MEQRLQDLETIFNSCLNLITNTATLSKTVSQATSDLTVAVDNISINQENFQKSVINFALNVGEYIQRTSGKENNISELIDKINKKLD